MRLPNERQLAQDFGLSQPTAREAIRVLEYMSLVEVRHGSGTYVTGDTQGFISKSLQALLEVTKTGVQEIMGLRLALSLYSIRLAVEKATEANLLAIESLETDLSEAFDAVDYKKSVEVSLCFQTALSAASHNPLKQKLWRYRVTANWLWNPNSPFSIV